MLKISVTKTRWLTAIIAGFIVFLFATLLSRYEPVQEMELRLLDQRFEWRGFISVEDSPIVLVAISEQADQEIPSQWPWPRELHGRLVDNLNEAGAKVIGVDVVFDQQDRISPENDQYFANVLRQYDNVILAGNILEGSRTGSEGGQVTQQQIIQPTPVLTNANVNPMGLIAVNLDSDGSLRRYRMGGTHLDQRFNTFAIELLRIYLDLDEIEINETSTHFEVGPYLIPKFDNHHMLINYHGDTGTFPEYSYELVIDDSTYTTVFEEIFEEEINSFYDLKEAGVFEDKIVIIGATMVELHDFFSMPYNVRLPGYEVHANALQTIMSGNFIEKITTRANFYIMLIFAIVMSLITLYSSFLIGLGAFLILFISYTASAIYAFTEHSFYLYMVGPLLTIFLSYTGSVSFNFFIEQREKSRIKGMFGSYVSPDLVEQMVESEDEPSLGGNEVYITAFFSDIQSFSAFSEILTPIQLVDLINEYLTAMTDLLTEERGTLDKYIGDAIVAFFGAPVPVEDHALRACVLSQKMLMKQAELRQKWKDEGDKWPDLVSRMQTRIGVNTGLMVTGNMGSQSRFNYTMMGDNVNLAARCESGAKAYGVYCMVTQSSKDEAEKYGDDCVFRYLDKIVVKGRTQPVAMYEIVGLREYLSPDAFECVKIFEEGISHYLNQEWDLAIEKFEQSAKLEPNQPNELLGIKTNPSLILLERCNLMKANPPGEDWDGVFVMTSK